MVYGFGGYCLWYNAIKGKNIFAKLIFFFLKQMILKKKGYFCSVYCKKHSITTKVIILYTSYFYTY